MKFLSKAQSRRNIVMNMMIGDGATIIKTLQALVAIEEITGSKIIF
jgi:hypothetical protein